MVAQGPIKSWRPAEGPVTTWTASAAARAAMGAAESDPQPPTFQQAGHLRAAFYGKALGLRLPRLMVISWDSPGVCDIAVMTEAVNAHVRRQDTYHSAFGFENGNVVRRTIADPGVIELEPTSHGTMSTEQLQVHALSTTPGTLDWDCFTFGVIQGAEHFTFYASIDHLHADGMSAGLIFLDIHLTYQDLMAGRASSYPEVTGYRDYAARQRQHVAGMTPTAPEIEAWVDFATDADGEWPSFPLPLGDTWTNNGGDYVTVEMLNDLETESFDAACRDAGARFSGGVMACAALADREFTGSTVYRGFTPSDTRTPGADTASVGWFASLFPVTVPIGDGSFADAARAAQASFDANRPMSTVPFERVLELVAVDELGIKLPSKSAMMVSFLDFRKIPVASLWEEMNFGIYGDNLSHGGINMWVNRHADRTTVTVSFPDNPEARHSVHRYVAALSLAFADVAKTAAVWIDQLNHYANTSAECAVCTGTR
jgi:hypothetical protein